MAAAGAAAEGLFRCVYEGCISGGDVGIERRPYHKNCKCALHNKKSRKQCTHAAGNGMKVSYPFRRAWSEGNLALMASSPSSPSSPSPSSSAQQPSPSSSPSAALVLRHQLHRRMSSCDEVQETVFFKV